MLWKRSTEVGSLETKLTGSVRTSVGVASHVPFSLYIPIQRLSRDGCLSRRIRQHNGDLIPEPGWQSAPYSIEDGCTILSVKDFTNIFLVVRHLIKVLSVVVGISPVVLRCCRILSVIDDGVQGSWPCLAKRLVFYIPPK